MLHGFRRLAARQGGRTPLKLRTILGELGVTEHVEGRGVNLEADIIAYPSSDFGSSFEQLLVLAPEGADAGPKDHVGLSLVWCGQRIPELPRPLPDRTIYVASELSYPDFRDLFGRLPERHVYLNLTRKRVFGAFASSYDIQRYADQVFETLGNPLMIVNSDRRLLASAGDFPANRADVLEEINQGYISEEVDGELEAGGILDDVRHAGHSIISENKRFGQRWVPSIISYHHMEMGRFDVLEQDRPITDADLELVDFAGSLAGVMIDKLGIAGERAGSGSSILEDILDNTFANEKTMRAQLALSSMPLDETYVLVQLRSERDITRSHLKRIAARVSHAFRNCLWTIRHGGLVALIALGRRTCPGWDAYDRAERILCQRKEFVATLSQNAMRAFVSEPFEQLGFAHDRYVQTKNLISARIDDEGPVVFFWLHRFEVLAGLSKSFGQVDMLLDKRVVAMSLYDRDHGTAYLETACRTVEFPGSPAEAAKALNVHRNTYFYRVNKIAELFFLDLKKGDDRLAVAFSTRFLGGMGGRLLFDVEDGPEAWKKGTNGASRL